MHVIDSLNAGGAQSVLLNLLSAESELRRRSIVVVLHGPGLLTRSFRAAGIRVRHLARSRFDPAIPIKLVRAIRAYRPQIVHAHLVVSSMLAEWCRLFFPKGTRVVCHLHNLHAAHGEDAYQDRLEHWLYKRCDGVVACSAAVARSLKAREGGCKVRIAVVPNALPSTSFTGLSVSARHAARKALRIPEETPIVLCVGRLVIQKNFRYALDIFAKLRATHPALLLIAGDGQERIPLTDYASEIGIASDVRFLGFRGDIPQLMHAADVLLVTSTEEAFGLVIVEAAARGFPTVATRFAAAHEVIRDGQTGVLIPYDDAARGAAALAELLDDRQLLDTMGDAALRFARARFTTREMARRLAKFYASL
jgi:glycosyltransferase involved in cell wall biosynthesis